MVTKESDPSALVWHSSLKKVFKECQRWLTYESNQPSKYIDQLSGFLQQPGAIDVVAGSECLRIGHYYSILACALSGKNNLSSLVEPLRWAVTFRSIGFRFDATVTLPWPERQPLLPLWSSMRAAGPVMMSQWSEAHACAGLLIRIAHKDQSLNPAEWRKDGWGKGTNDAFLIQLFSQAFGIDTHYTPVNAMIPEYRALLDRWRTTDEAQFRAVMQTAAEFHLSRSKDGTDRNKYEFEKDIDRVYPAELLAVQALRRRDGLPEFETGHLLIDTPWRVVRDLPRCEPHPLAVAVEQRLIQDFPGFR
jgi:hypothetical protein